MMMFCLMARNLKVFFRDRMAVFFSFLSVIITIGMYVLFLGNMMERNVGPVAGARFVADSWIMAGLLAMVSITSTMGAYGIMVEDRTKKILRDFRAAPLPRTALVGGYVFAALMIGLALSLTTFVLGQIYIVAYGGEFLSPPSVLKVLAIMVVTVVSSSAMMIFVVSLFDSNNAYSAAASVIGALIGFLTGIYIPLGALPTGVQYVVKFFPPSHGAALFRQVMMEEAMVKAFANAPTAAVAEFKHGFGVVFDYGSFTADVATHIAFLLGSALVFFALATWNLSRKGGGHVS